MHGPNCHISSMCANLVCKQVLHREEETAHQWSKSLYRASYLVPVIQRYIGVSSCNVSCASSTSLTEEKEETERPDIQGNLLVQRYVIKVLKFSYIIAPCNAHRYLHH